MLSLIMKTEYAPDLVIDHIYSAIAAKKGNEFRNWETDVYIGAELHEFKGIRLMDNLLKTYGAFEMKPLPGAVEVEFSTFSGLDLIPQVLHMLYDAFQSMVFENFPQYVYDARLRFYRRLGEPLF